MKIVIDSATIELVAVRTELTAARARIAVLETDLRWARTAIAKLEARLARVPDAVVLPSATPLTFTYANHRGETAQRTVVPLGIRYGTTEWHPEPQWLLRAYDLGKQAEREFAMKNIGARVPSREEVAKDIWAAFGHGGPPLLARGVPYGTWAKALAAADAVLALFAAQETKP